MEGWYFGRKCLKFTKKTNIRTRFVLEHVGYLSCLMEHFAYHDCFYRNMYHYKVGERNQETNNKDTMYKVGLVLLQAHVSKNV